MREIPLTRGKVAIVDDEDYERLVGRKWHAFPGNAGTDTWYARGYIDGRNVSMHRFIMDAPRDRQVDHKNGDGLFNVRANLRLATRYQNAANQRTSCKSGFRGVEAHKLHFRASIKSEGRRYRIGHFKDPIDAARAYDARARELHGEFAILNFPEVAP